MTTTTSSDGIPKEVRDAITTMPESARVVWFPKETHSKGEAWEETKLSIPSHLQHTWKALHTTNFWVWYRRLV